MSTISTHVLDTALGKPAAGIHVILEKIGERDPQSATAVGGGTTDSDGRLRGLIAPGVSLGQGTYRLRFDVGAYFARANRESFYPEVVVTFVIRAGEEHYHVPLLLNPYGYSTYRGS